MGKRKNKKKLGLKKQAVRKLDTLTQEQLADTAGGTELSLSTTTTTTSLTTSSYTIQDPTKGWGGWTGGGRTTFGCQPSDPC